MSAHQYPFIDVAVHERVRLPFARGEAVVLFSIDMRRVLWVNGRGAALFGHASIYDFIDAPVPSGDVVFRQLETAARQLAHSGLGRNLLLRIGSGYRGLPVTAHVERMTLAPGEDAILFSMPTASRGEPVGERAASLIDGFDDPDTHMAVLDGDGAIVAASAGFAALGISDDARRRMVDTARRESGGLVKRPVPTGKGLLPAALGRISADPALNLLFAVETILGHLDPEREATAPKAGEAPVTAGEVTQTAEATSAMAPGDRVPDDAHQPGLGSDDRPAVTASAEPEGERDTASSAPVEREAAPGAASISADETDDGEAIDMTGPGATTLPETEQPATVAHDTQTDATASGIASRDEIEQTTAAASEQAAAFSRSMRPVRFVWKIDAEGLFSELSDEFAEVVGAHAAGVIGLPFADVAKRFGFDADGAISELLRRRDTWSGKTIHWPVEGTSLVVPVDLAALPTYSRNREFDGFRGFGIVRTADALEDADARGLNIAATAEEAIDPQAHEPPADEPVPTTVDRAGDDGYDQQEYDRGKAPSVLDELLAEEVDGGTPAAANAASPPADTAHGAETHDASPAGVAIDADDDFRGERPALRLVDTPGRRHSDKIVQLDDRRNGITGALTTGEQAAFREIARQLGETFGKRQPTIPPSSGDGDQPQDDDVDLAAGAMRPDMPDEGEKVVSQADLSDARAPAGADEIPGLEVGAHADDVPPKSVSITGPRTAMDYGLTASVVDALPVALLIHAGDLLIHANPEFLALTGFSSLDALEGAGGLSVLLDRPAEEDHAHAGTMLLRHADGATIAPVSARLQSIRWEDGTALMLALSRSGPIEVAWPGEAETAVPAAQDTAHDDALEALRDEANELRSILETATDGVVVVDHEGEIRSINRSASALFNYDEAEIRGKPFAMLFAHESQKAVLDYLAGLAGHGVASVLNDGREVIGREASGGFIPLFMTMGRLSSSSGYCAVIRDITQWKRTEEELRNAKRAAETANAHKSEFLARVSHEIRTPLNAIIGFSDMMAGERFGPIGHPRYVEYANDIGRSGRHVLDIVNDLLDISKIEAGEMELDFTAVGLNETVSEAVALVQPQANGQRVIIRTSLSTSVPQVVADLRSIKQIALNILANAIRFTPSGGQIVVSTSYEANGCVVLRIRDTGVGMTRSELEQAMKPFRQVTTGARKRGDGTGLGLPLTKAMVDANRAQFSISSSPNEGTLVEVTFPSQRVLAV